MEALVKTYSSIKGSALKKSVFLSKESYDKKAGKEKKYESGDHLGNVRATVSDTRKCTFTTEGDIENTAEVVTESDYYPFGMQMPGRGDGGSVTNKYRFGYNGKEKDDEFGSEGSHLNFDARILDTRLGRFLSIDPLTRGFPMLTPYQFASNNPIWNIDLDGLEGTTYTRLIFYGGGTRENDNSAFYYSALNVAKNYGLSGKSVTAIKSAKQIIESINNSPDNSIKSLDIIAHSSNYGIYIYEGADFLGGKTGDKNKNASLYAGNLTKGIQGSNLTENAGSLNDIDFGKFTNDAIIELHNCRAAANDVSNVWGLIDNIAEEASEKLYAEGKTKAVVIAHTTKMSPMIKGEKTSVQGQDYRHSERVVYHNGAILFKTTSTGRISRKTIDKYLKMKEEQGDKYEGSKQTYKK